MLKHTIRRAAITALAAVAAWSTVVWLGGPRWVGDIVIGIVLSVSHYNAGWLALTWARALLTGTYVTDAAPQRDRWSLTDAEMQRSVRAVAIWEDDYDRAIGSVDVAAHDVGIDPPYMHIGRRMSTEAFAAGHRPGGTVVCVAIELLDPERSEDLHRALVDELRLAQRWVPLWGTIAALVAVSLWTSSAAQWGIL